MAGLGAVVLAGCATLPAGALLPFSSDVVHAAFAYDARIPFGKPPASAFVNDNGTPRINDVAAYETFWREYAPLVREWGADPRIALNPAYVAALFGKESGYEPFATSNVPANGIAQFTHIADVDLVEITTNARAWNWARAEVRSWPRHPAVHTPAARKVRTDSLVAAGAVTAANEYFFAPRQQMRGAMIWLRLLATNWLEDEWPGAHGSFARERLNGGRPITDRQLFDLVTVSYNQGTTYVRALIERHGTDWQRHLNAEAADYLARIREYTIIVQQAPARR